MLKIIQAFHEKGYAHGNIKLNTFQFGVSDRSNVLYLNDIQQAVSYVKKGKHIRREIANLKVAPNEFMNIDRMQGYEASRKGDIQSLFYLLVYLYRGELPWSRFFKNERKNEEREEFSTCVKDMSMSKEETK